MKKIIFFGIVFTLISINLWSQSNTFSYFTNLKGNYYESVSCDDKYIYTHYLTTCYIWYKSTLSLKASFDFSAHTGGTQEVLVDDKYIYFDGDYYVWIYNKTNYTYVGQGPAANALNIAIDNNYFYIYDNFTNHGYTTVYNKIFPYTNVGNIYGAGCGPPAVDNDYIYFWASGTNDGLYTNKPPFTKIRSFQNIRSMVVDDKYLYDNNGKIWSKVYPFNLVYSNYTGVSYGLAYPMAVDSQYIYYAQVTNLLIFKKNYLSKTNFFKQGVQNLQQQIVIAPNPFKPNSPGNKGYVTFYNLTPNAEIKVYTLSGRLIVDLNTSNNNGQYNWDTSDKHGKLLPAGLYLCHITNPQGQKRTLKLVIQR